MSPTQLPHPLRLSAWVAVVVGGLVGFSASGGAMSALSPVELSEVLKATSGIRDPAVREIVEVSVRTELELSGSLRAPRGAVLLLLSFACGLVVVSALRLIYPGGLPRSGMRRIVGGALLAAGLLRTVDGAIQLVVARRTATALSRLTLPGPTPPEIVEVMAAGYVFVTVGWTALVVALLVGAGQYLRSDKAKQLVDELDATTAPR